MTKCHCFSCTRERVKADPDAPRMFGQPTALMRMFLCETCGNKRCPHAADHRLSCTGSNEPGQPGSLYEQIPLPNVAAEDSAAGHSAAGRLRDEPSSLPQQATETGRG